MKPRSWWRSIGIFFEDKILGTIKIFSRKYLSLIITLMSLVLITVTLMAYLVLYAQLNYMTRPDQAVTVSSEGPAAEMYPDSMGHYNLLRDVYRYDRPVYKHVDRKDRFIIFAGKVNF